MFNAIRIHFIGGAPENDRELTLSLDTDSPWRNIPPPSGFIIVDLLDKDYRVTRIHAAPLSTASAPTFTKPANGYQYAVHGERSSYNDICPLCKTAPGQPCFYLATWPG